LNEKPEKTHFFYFFSGNFSFPTKMSEDRPLSPVFRLEFHRATLQVKRNLFDQPMHKTPFLRHAKACFIVQTAWRDSRKGTVGNKGTSANEAESPLASKFSL
jgi:hypothetical protein